MSDLTPWIVTVHLPDGEQILFHTQPAEQVGFHRMAEISGDKESIYAGDLIITADTVQIARLSDWIAVHATPDEGEQLADWEEDPGDNDTSPYAADYAWSDYRKEYAPNPGHMAAAHKAFHAGWEAARASGEA